MRDPEATRPCWRRKRWAGVALVLWLAAIYPVSPAAYLYGRGWLSSGLSEFPGRISGQPVVGWWRTWNGSWFELGHRHAAGAPGLR